MRVELWNKPVEVTTDGGDHFRSVRNSREALECLLTCCGDKKGKSFSVARRTCLSAIEGGVAPNAAEQAFRAAAKDAGILR